ncbi:MAG: hypothetical protein GX089_17300 [Fibrobacter sp.]|jgi:hypothetical protein|nr:hypothetical protein [Fibrobacter sp.]
MQKLVDDGYPMEIEKKKRLLRELRELAKIARERENQKEIIKLKNKFLEWENGALDHNNLPEIIRESHEIISRNIWKAHDFDDDFIVIRAVYKNIIGKEELSEELYEYLREKIDRLKDVLGNFED